MRVKSLLLSIVAILLVANIGAGLANGPNPKVNPPSLDPTKPGTAAPSGPVQPELISLNFTGADLVEVVHVSSGSSTFSTIATAHLKSRSASIWRPWL